MAEFVNDLATHMRKVKGEANFSFLELAKLSKRHGPNKLLTNLLQTARGGL
jgi:hypothetical protein